MPRKYVVIARTGVKRGRFFDGTVVPAGAAYLPMFRQVFGPASRTACLIWQATHCDPMPEWRGSERRVVILESHRLQMQRS